jgi:hypothetical protein
MSHTFPTLKKAMQAIYLDAECGVMRTAKEANATMELWMKELRKSNADFVLDACDRELAALSSDDFETLLIGEQGVVQVSSTLEEVLNQIGTMAGF